MLDQYHKFYQWAKEYMKPKNPSELCEYQKVLDIKSPTGSLTSSTQWNLLKFTVLLTFDETTVTKECGFLTRGEFLGK